MFYDPFSISRDECSHIQEPLLDLFCFLVCWFVLIHGSYNTGVFMGPTNIPFTSQAATAFQGFPSMGVPVPAAPGLIGNMMGQNTSMMVGMPMPNGFMGNAQTGVMPLPQNVVGPQGGMVGQMGAPQSKFGLPQAQQPQWNLSQVGLMNCLSSQNPRNYVYIMSSLF